MTDAERGRLAELLASADVAALLAALNCDGEEARIVGGAVRNALLGEPVADIDVATTARPDETMRRARAAGFKAVPTGIEHGTVTVVIDGAPFEVTTLRRDVETDGRRAVVAFGRDFREDALRRDFTINALGLDAGMSWSCYDPTTDGRHCGLCDSCRLRAKGFAEAGLEDPTHYAARP